MIGEYTVVDLHVHSHLSGCADRAPAYSTDKLLRHAAALGLDAVGFSDHVLEPQQALPAELVADLDGRPGLERTEALRRELAGLDLAGLPRIAVGAEVDAFGGGLFSVTPAGRARLDHAVVSANHPQVTGTPAPAGAEPRDVAAHLLEKTRQAVRSGLATTLAHPLLPMGRAEPHAVYAAYFTLGLEALLEEARDAGVALGFSRHLVTNQNWVRLKDAERLYQLAAGVGVKLAFETDCHAFWHMSCIVPMVELARRFGLGPGSFLSELPSH